MLSGASSEGAFGRPMTRSAIDPRKDTNGLTFHQYGMYQLVPHINSDMSRVQLLCLHFTKWPSPNSDKPFKPVGHTRMDPGEQPRNTDSGTVLVCQGKKKVN